MKSATSIDRLHRVFQFISQIGALRCSAVINGPCPQALRPKTNRVCTLLGLVALVAAAGCTCPSPTLISTNAPPVFLTNVFSNGAPTMMVTNMQVIVVSNLTTLAFTNAPLVMSGSGEKGRTSLPEHIKSWADAITSLVELGGKVKELIPKTQGAVQTALQTAATLIDGLDASHDGWSGIIDQIKNGAETISALIKLGKEINDLIPETKDSEVGDLLLTTATRIDKLVKAWQPEPVLGGICDCPQLTNLNGQIAILEASINKQTNQLQTLTKTLEDITSHTKTLAEKIDSLLRRRWWVELFQVALVVLVIVWLMLKRKPPGDSSQPDGESPIPPVPAPTTPQSQPMKSGATAPSGAKLSRGQYLAILAFLKTFSDTLDNTEPEKPEDKVDWFNNKKGKNRAETEAETGSST